jgi:hypothetical protein
MKNIFKCIQVVLLFGLLSKSGNAQDYNSYRTSDAVLLQVNDNVHIEGRLKKVILALSNNSSQLNVRLTIPFHLIDSTAEVNTMSEAPGLLFNLKMMINPWQIQDDLTSTKVFTTKGVLILNNITQSATVDFIPFPASTNLDGEFKLSMIIQFKAGDFGLDPSQNNMEFIIKIGDARVNRE